MQSLNGNSGFADMRYVSWLDGQDQEVFTLGERCTRCDRKTCGTKPKQEISHCSQLTQRRLAMRCNTPPILGVTPGPSVQAIA